MSFSKELKTQALKNFAKREKVSSLGVSALGLISIDKVFADLRSLNKDGILNSMSAEHISGNIYDIPTRDAVIIAARNNTVVLAELVDQWLALIKDEPNAAITSADPLYSELETE